MAYNTFSNDIITNDAITNDTITNDAIISTNNLCIICLQNVSLCKDEVTLMNDMHFLIKNCDCVCYSHHKCIETWIKTNSVCPICRKPISFPEKKSTVIDMPSIQYDETQTYKKTLRGYLIILIIVTILLFCMNILFL
jgi:hypothetical protein